MLLCTLGFLGTPSDAWAKPTRSSVRVTIDFKDVDLSVFIRFISELTGKNFVLDDKIKGKITVYSPTKVSVRQAYDLFLATLEVRQLVTIPRGNITRIVRMSDVSPDRSVFVYKLKNANAKDTAALLTQLASQKQADSQAAGRRVGLRPAGEFDGPVHVLADPATNSLLISATSNSFNQLRKVITELDAPRKQVFLEAVILEVAMDRLRELGTNPLEIIAAGEAGSFRGLAGFNRVPEDISLFAQALSGVASGGTLTVLNSVNARAFLQLLMTLTDTNIISTPQVLASDNEKAKIVVGENRPFPTGQSQSISGATLVTIERRDVGVTLEMTPQVLEGDRVRIKVKQEITAIAENVAQTIGIGEASVPVGPTTTKRAMETVAIARNQQTIVVGGLVRDNVTINESKIPLLGDIPFLGWLFRSQSTRSEKLNLLVFLTPHILDNDVDVVKLNREKATDAEAMRLKSNNQVSSTLEQALQEQLLNFDQK